MLFAFWHIRNKSFGEMYLLGFFVGCISQVMCMQYWPPSLDKTEVYGDIHIGIVNEEQLANFQIRTFRIWKEKLDVSILQVWHWHEYS